MRRLEKRCTRLTAIFRTTMVKRSLARRHAASTRLQAYARGAAAKHALETAVRAAADRLLDVLFDAWSARNEPLLQRSRLVAFSDGDSHFLAPPCLGLALRLDEVKRVLAKDPEARHYAARDVAETLAAIGDQRPSAARDKALNATLQYVEASVNAVVATSATPTTTTQFFMQRRDSPPMARFTPIGSSPQFKFFASASKSPPPRHNAASHQKSGNAHNNSHERAASTSFFAGASTTTPRARSTVAAITMERPRPRSMSVDPRPRSGDLLRSPKNAATSPAGATATTGNGNSWNSGVYDGIRSLNPETRDGFFRAFGIGTSQKLKKRKLSKMVWQHKAHIVDSARLVLLLCDLISGHDHAPEDGLHRHMLQTPADRSREHRIRQALLAAANAAILPPHNHARPGVSWREGS